MEITPSHLPCWSSLTSSGSPSRIMPPYEPNSSTPPSRESSVSPSHRIRFHFWTTGFSPISRTVDESLVTTC